MSPESQELFTFSCTCGAKHHARRALVGRKAKCGKCGTTLTIPKPDTAKGVAKADMKAAEEQLCSICQTTIAGGDAKTTCSKCGLPFHAECWKENLGCSAYGCENVNVLKAGPDIRIGEGEAAAAAHPGAAVAEAAAFPASAVWAPGPAARRPHHPAAKRNRPPLGLILAACGAVAVIVLAILAISSFSNRSSETAAGDDRSVEAPSIPASQPTSEKPKPSASRHEVAHEVAQDASRAAAASPLLQLEWPEAEREHAKLFLDGQERTVPGSGDVTFRLPPRSEAYRFRLERPGYEPLEFHRQSIEGEPELLEYRVEWTAAFRIPDDWLQDLAKAKQRKKPILLFFDRSDDEFVCRKLLCNVLLTPQFAGRIGNDFVVVHIDMPSSPAGAVGAIEDQGRNARLAAEFGVDTYPMLYALDDEGRALLVRDGRLLGTVQDGLTLLMFAQKRLQTLTNLLQTFHAAEGQAKQDAAEKLLDFVAEEDLDRFYQAETQEWQAALPAERRGRLRAVSYSEYVHWVQRFLQAKSSSTQQLETLAAEFGAWAKTRRHTIPNRGAALCYLFADVLARLNRREEAAACCNEGLAMAPADMAIRARLEKQLGGLPHDNTPAEQPAKTLPKRPSDKIVGKWMWGNQVVDFHDDKTVVSNNGNRGAWARTGNSDVRYQVRWSWGEENLVSITTLSGKPALIVKKKEGRAWKTWHCSPVDDRSDAVETAPSSLANAPAKTIDLSSVIRQAIARGEIEKAMLGKEVGNSFREVSDQNGFLVGLNLKTGGHGPGYRQMRVDAVQPIFSTASGIRFGQWHGGGERPPTQVTVQAKAGYAIGGIQVTGDQCNGLRIIFVRIKQGSIQPDDKYESPWYGERGTDTAPMCGAKGKLIVGVKGNADSKQVRGIGLVSLR